MFAIACSLRPGPIGMAEQNVVARPPVEQAAVKPAEEPTAPSETTVAVDDLIPDHRPGEISVAEKIARGEAEVLRLKQRWESRVEADPTQLRLQAERSYFKNRSPVEGRATSH